MSLVQNRSLLCISLATAILVGAAFADETPSHYAAEPSETLEQAVKNFVTYNALVEEVLARDPLTAEDMEKVHELTYTLEEALARINAEFADLPDTLEVLHKASEGDDPTVMRDAAVVYLSTANAFQGTQER
ncbi:DUF6746 family protein [Roseovarius phycicola]|uniref:DUF6746 family protein n=1 Tax=Roseovarius phycicola TaxID=3080976 RepID=A0ABZ2HKG9_9RHOB